MAENIASRVGRMISGTANMLVDAVENMAPEMVMEEAIREIDRAIDDVRVELGRNLSKQHMATRRLADENRKHGEVSEKVQIALNSEREDLAEAAISQVLDIEAQIPVLESTISDTKDVATELEGFIAALQARKREMKDELAAYREASAASGGSDSAGSGNAGGGDSADASVRKAEEAFERALEGAGGVSSSGSVPNKADAAKRAELDDLARKNRIQERLEAFKTGGD